MLESVAGHGHELFNQMDHGVGARKQPLEQREHQQQEDQES